LRNTPFETPLTRSLSPDQMPSQPLDMNALEHTYLALYARQGNQVLVEQLIEGMKEVDRTSQGELAPRFLAFPDDRDFFYFTRRESSR